ncbi:G-type lectin S-receptor-like serine/threonine-protein kinase [Dorcoceras hygrometricum]|uniref:G-type lectin S-receptor-like serine/threonine-protein kinase n=1 Tax=Dorcoceras hygrometricum TaxID=472368 RepID=A0A2Z7C2U8_9LAMI|nr:G-type lectin S-receptor-like serine/threonine-protein kinase [Dorcoceras hygrometricum]
MSLFDLQDVCLVIGSLATLDLPMVVDLIGIYVLKGPYCMLTTTNWFLQALSVIPRGSWDDVARRFTMIRWASPKLRFRNHNGCGPTANCIPEPLRVTQDMVVLVQNNVLRKEMQVQKAALSKELDDIQHRPPPPSLLQAAAAAAAAAGTSPEIRSGQFDVENPIVLISSGLLVHSDEGVPNLVVDRIDESTAINREAPGS